jgi:transposase-like protein
MRTAHRSRPSPPRSAFAGFRYPPDVIVLAVRWYLRFGLSYRDVQELLTERGIEVDHVTVYRWVQRFTPLLVDAARPCRHAVGDRWQVDETYVKVAGQWRYVYRAVDQFGQVGDVLISAQRDMRAARRFFERAVGTTKVTPGEVTTDQAPVYPAVLEELLPAAWHRTERYGNNRVECDHGRLKARLRPMRGLKQDRSARVIIAGHGFVQNLRRGGGGAGDAAGRDRVRRVGLGDLIRGRALRLRPALVRRNATVPWSRPGYNGSPTIAPTAPPTRPSTPSTTCPRSPAMSANRSGIRIANSETGQARRVEAPLSSSCGARSSNPSTSSVFIAVESTTALWAAKLSGSAVASQSACAGSRATSHAAVSRSGTGILVVASPPATRNNVASCRCGT